MPGRSGGWPVLGFLILSPLAACWTPPSSFLGRFGLEERERTLNTKDLPVLAEVHVNGTSQVGAITALRPTKDPTVKVQLFSGDGGIQVVDVGQITNVWDSALSWDPTAIVPLSVQIQQEWREFPLGLVEASLDQLYRSHQKVKVKKVPSSLTKNQIAPLVASIASSEEDRLEVDRLLRQLLKSGMGTCRLVDAAATARLLYNCNSTTVLQQAMAAHLLGLDAQAGGRFKRQPCIAIHQTTDSLSILNGGWRTVDSSVRAMAEAKKFAERVVQQSDNKWTMADQRISQRLECLAMGEVFHKNARETTSLELDVREALKALGFQPTPEGAQKALLQMGRWSHQKTSDPDQRQGAQPWSQTVLEAARGYRDHQATVTKDSALQNGYSDLTDIPFLCIDPAKVSFRDDAIGVRPRAATGRKLLSGASKWEILISIADVSDIYATPDNHSTKWSQHLMTLREAAASRGVSRYDLPLGPLHLLPPVVLQALAFRTVTAREQPNERTQQIFNRCITVWVYLDQNTGKILDAGMERTIISPPVALSYQEGTDLLDGKLDNNQNSVLRGRGVVLRVVEQCILSWSQQYLQNNRAAQKREERLGLKEFVATQRLQHHHSGQTPRDNGHDGFQRTRGHKLVDASLDLYSYIVAGLLRRAKAPFPQQSGIGPARGSRVATSPLRRYVDGMAQRQALAVLCGYGGPPMTQLECNRVSKEATDAYNTLSNIRSVKVSDAGSTRNGSSNPKSAIRSLQMFLSEDRNKIVPAVGTGRSNEVVITGVGVLARCQGCKGTLKPGERILVQVKKIDVESCNVAVSQAT